MRKTCRNCKHSNYTPENFAEVTKACGFCGIYLANWEPKEDASNLNEGEMDKLIWKKDAVDALTTYIYNVCKGMNKQMSIDRCEVAAKSVIGELPTVQLEHDYKKAFSIACELLIGANLFGTTEETMFDEIMEKEGVVSSLGYERYIMENLSRLTGEDDGTD